ncbi:MAG: Striated muscle preferentially expressed protein kinase [Parcubacteria group bacterium GW2011_GWC2_42_12]|nr:MAG: Striated muscle preferentially expressed protein kinase [Parcubacteria group bacterium GW2011_GWC2_42_12]
MPKVEGLKKPNESAEQAPEKPTLDPEVEKQLAALADGIKSKEDLLAGLGRVAREKILSGDAEAEKEISAPQEVGRVDLKAEYDAQNFEPADRKLRFKDWLLRKIGAGGSDYALKGEDGPAVDKRKLKPGVKEAMEKGEIKFFEGELEQAAEKVGLKPEDVKAKGLSMKYVEGENGIENILLRAATAEEGDKAAAEILEKQLKEQEQAGIALTNQRASLDAFRKEQESIQDMIKPKDRPVLAEKEQGIEKEIQDKQASLDNYKKDRLPQLSEHKKHTEEALIYLSGKLEEATARENEFGKEIEGIEEKIKRLKGAKQMLALFGDKMVEFEEQKAKDKLHRQGFIDAKQTLRQNIEKFKRNKAEVDKMIERINKIGKTPAELKAEQEKVKAEKQAEANQRQIQTASAAEQPKEKLPTEPGLSANWQDNALTGAPEVEKRGVNFGKPRIKIDRKGKPIAEAPTAVEQEPIAEAAALGGVDEGQRQTKNIEKPAPAVAKTPNQAARAAAPEARLEQEQRPERAVDAEMEIKEMPVREWLNALFEERLTGKADKIMRRTFNIKKRSDFDVVMTREDAKEAFAYYLSDLHVWPTNATWKIADQRFRNIRKPGDRSGHTAEETALMASAGSQKRPDDQAPVNINGHPESGSVLRPNANSTVEPGLDTEVRSRASVNNEIEAILDHGPTVAGQAELLARDQAEVRKPRGGGKLKGNRGEKSSVGNRAARRLTERQLEEAALRDEKRAKELAGTPKKDEAAPKIEVGASPLFNNGLGVALGQVEGLVKKGQEKPTDVSGQIGTTSETAAKPEQILTEEERIKLLVEAVMASLKEGEKEGRKLKRAMEQSFGSPKKPVVIETEEQLVNAVFGYMKSMGNGNGVGEFSKKAAEQLVEKIKNKLNQ